MVSIRQNLVDQSRYELKCPYSMSPTRIVVHNTANDASANNEILYMRTNDNETSFHYAVDDIEAVQGILENRNGWHAGDGGNGIGNRQGIAIEICYSKSGGDRFIKAEKNAVELIVDILKRYNWGVDKVTKHQDYSGKYCPARTLDMGWQRFLDMVSAALRPATLPVPNAIKYDKPQTFICNLPKVQMWDLTTNPNYKSAKEFSKGDEFIAYGYIAFNNTKYLVTEYSFNKGIKNGVNILDMFNKTADDAQKALDAAAAKAAADAVIAENARIAAAKAAQAKAEADAAAAKAAADKKAADDAKKAADELAAKTAKEKADAEKAKADAETKILKEQSDHAFISVLKELWNLILSFMAGKGKQL